MNPYPSPITEAAGLLGSGAIFARRVGLRAAGDPSAPADILAGFKRGGFSIYLGDAPILHFDLDGRWQRAFVAGKHYLKGLDTTVREVDRVRESDQMILRRRTLDSSETAALDARVAAEVATVGAALAAGQYVPVGPPEPSRTIDPAELTAFLARIARWDAGRWADHRAAYHRAYGDGPPPFLPPDCPNPVILQPTRAMTPRAVGDHARAVAALLGERLNQCRDVFLAGSGWIDRPPAAVLACLAAITDVFPILPDQGRPRGEAGVADAPRLATIHGWLAALPHPAPSPDDWSQFRAAHLGRITLRVDPRSPLDPAAIRVTVADLKAAAIRVGLALVVDPAATDFPAASWVAALPLGAGDLITLIAAPVGSASPDHPSLTDPKARLAASLPPQGPRVVVYNPEKQWI